MNFIAKLNISVVTRTLLYVLIFFQPFNHFNSFREISFYSLLAILLVRICKGEIKNITFNDKTIMALSLLVGWSLFVSISGPFYADSLNAIRKNLLQEVVIFLVILMEFKSIRDLRPLFWIVVSSFAIVTFASIIENIIKDWDTFRKLTPEASWRSVSTYFYARYPNKATFYLPFIAAWLVSVKEVPWKKWIGASVLISGFVLVYIYNGRTQLAAVSLAVFLIILLAKRYKLAAVIVITAVLCVTLIVNLQDDSLVRYKSLLKADTYTTDTGLGLNSRLVIWKEAISLIKERPLTGYGYGWKKIAWVFKEKNERDEEFWENIGPRLREYFVVTEFRYGVVNPHNLPLQIIFEIGLIGFAIFLWLWGTVVHKIVKTIKAGGTTESKNFMLSAFGLILSYILINITNGYWQEAYGNMIFLFMAAVFVMHRETLNGQ